MIRFGPSGNSRSFYEEGFKSSVEAPAYLAKMGLNAYEYAGGHGIGIGEETARRLGEAARIHGISVSVHAPYYLSLATQEIDKYQKNMGYLLSSARAVTWFGGNRVVFHLGSPGRRHRGEALRAASDALREARHLLDGEGFSQVILCPETIGHPTQLGSLHEILDLCNAHERMLPTIDFGHVHAAGCGALTSPEDFARVLQTLISCIGIENARHFHAHFSKIEYTSKGEKRHVSFSDEGYGPDFSDLAPLLAQYGLEPTIICESRDTQAEDAVFMRDAYLKAMRAARDDSRQ